MYVYIYIYIYIYIYTHTTATRHGAWAGDVAARGGHPPLEGPVAPRPRGAVGCPAKIIVLLLLLLLRIIIMIMIIIT